MNNVVERIRSGLTPYDMKAKQSETFYMADDMATKTAFELAVLKQKLSFKTWAISDRPGYKKYTVFYDLPSELFLLGSSFQSCFNS